MEIRSQRKAGGEVLQSLPTTHNSLTISITGFILALIFLLAAGCSKPANQEPLPPILRIGLLPDENREEQQRRFEPLLQHLSKRLDMRCDLVFSDNYDDLIEKFGEHEVDIAYFGGLTFVKAKMAYNAKPLVMRDIDIRFTSYFVTKAEGSARTINDYKGKRIAFGSRLSTSGHLMPRHFLELHDIVPETYFREVHYSGTHDKTIEMVAQGKADVGAVNSEIFRAMLANGRINEETIKILWETHPYSNYVWVVQSNLSERARTKLRDAFLVLSPNNEEHSAILSNFGAGGFLPATVEMFFDLEKIAMKLGTLE